MIKGAIFDVDGTLIDSMPMWSTFGSGIILSRGLVPEDGLDEKIRYFSLRETAEYISKAYAGLGTPDELEDLCMSSTWDFYMNKVELKPGVRELLAFLEAEGVKMYIATATYRPLIEGALRRLGVLDFFKGIVTCAEVGAGKDKPDVFMAAKRSLGLEGENIWVFEDAMHAMLTAKECGFRVCGVYDITEADHKDEISKICDVYVNSFEELSPSCFI